MDLWRSLLARSGSTGHVITGLFVSLTPIKFRHFGVELQPDSAMFPARQESELTILCPRRWSYYFKREIEAFRSVASLSRIARVRVRRVGPRCVGICLHHHDGSLDVLGQWDPSDVSSIGDIYNSNAGGDLTAMTFHMSGPGKESFVEDISIGVHPGPNNLLVKCSDSEKVMCFNTVNTFALQPTHPVP